MKYVWRKFLKALERAFVTACAAAACGGEVPEGVAPAGWVSYFSFPGGYEIKSLAACGHNVWAVAIWENEFTVILKYRDNGIITEYKQPRYEGLLTSIYFNGTRGWAGGAKFVNVADRRPLLLRYAGGRWTEIDLPATARGVISDIAGETADGGLWFLIDPNFNESAYSQPTFERKGILFRFRGGILKGYEGLGYVRVCKPRAGVLPSSFLVTSFGLNPDGDIFNYVVGPAGPTGVRERIPANVVDGLYITQSRPLTSDGQVYYFGVSLSYGYSGVLKRRGPFGSPIYEVTFLANRGPYFNDIAYMALAQNLYEPRPGISSDGVAVGFETTLVIRNAQFLLERLPYTLDFSALCPNDGYGFWAAALNDSTYNYELIYHP